ncbi:peptidoglycan DD-metalloendopeptidase family protein [Falsibacillus pallidus]|uniref:Murein DD-endopeptidase MepM/ murein hydrolase activator NlpD n=1 Tax=Falsibacillus pallidus TaxID=493781 RepID=A0A370GAS2_9BACI|nr:peptidoglycan DD-metalloendopeptidase family protein [Falsibacillus pallidus]RDI40895.1 murein DD-endopeptidase MepM/ murein hydrolase activator NlpD [Falsibacillus pallidus]
MNWRQKLSNVSSNFPKLNINVSTNLIKKTAVAALVLSAFSFHSVSANDSKSGLNKVYHVYIKDQYMGTVTDPAVIQKVIDEKTAASSDAYSGFHVEVGKNLKYIPEQVFQTDADNDETAKKVEEQVSVLADAVAITVDGKPVVYLKDKDSADQVLKQLKLSYATQKELDALDAQKSSSTSLPRLKEDETRLVDVSLKESLNEEKGSVEPGKILEPEQAAKYLQKGTLEEKKYQVQEGDVLGAIASKHDLSTAELIKLNPGLKEDSVLKIGSDINVTAYEPLIHVIMKREVYKVEPVPYEKKVVEDSSMYKGETKVVQEGKEGKSATTYVISEQNGERVLKEVKDQKVLSEPVNYIVKKGTKVVPSRGTGHFVWPAVGGYVSSEMGYRWGKMHKGLDIARPSDRTIKAADNGVVVTAGYSDDGYGNKVVIDHKNGYQTLYAHMSSVSVHVGQTVTAGSKIGVMGETGEATGVHLHFEVRYHGKLVNPRTKL